MKIKYDSPHSSRPEKLGEGKIGDYSVQTFMKDPATGREIWLTTLFYPQRAVTGFQGCNTIDIFSVPESVPELVLNLFFKF